MRLNEFEKQREIRLHQMRERRASQRPIKTKSSPVAKVLVSFVILCVGFYLVFQNVNFKSFFKSNSDANSTNSTALNPEQTQTPTPSPSPSPSPSPTPPPKGDKAALLAKFDEILGAEKDRYGIYVIGLEDGEEFGLNSEKVLPPASIYKTALAMLVLKDIDNGKYTLDRGFVLKTKHRAYTSDSMYYYQMNKAYTVNKYLEIMIKLSDNTAMTALEDMIGGTKVINERIKKEFGVTTFFRYPHEATVKDIGKVFKHIYDQSYLKKETNDYLLNLLKNTASYFQDKIPAGLPLKERNIVVAHKIGAITTGRGSCYADAGIIYGELVDYILIVTNEDISQAQAKIKIPKISKEVYNYFHPTMLIK